MGAEVVDRAACRGHVDEAEERRPEPRVLRWSAASPCWSSERTGWRAGGGEARRRARARSAAPPPRRSRRRSARARLPSIAHPTLLRDAWTHDRSDAGEVLRHHEDRGRARGGAPRRLGDRPQPLERQPAPLRPGHRRRDQRRAAAPGRDRRRVRQRDRSTRSRPRSRTSSSRWSSCTATRGRPSATEVARRTGLQGDQGDAGAQRPPTSRRPRRFAPTSTSRRPPARDPGRHRGELRLGARSRGRRSRCR